MNYPSRNLPFNPQHRGGGRTARRINTAAANFTPRGNVRGGRIDGPPAPPPRRFFTPRKLGVSLAAAQTDVRYNASGNVFWVTAGSSTTATMTVRFVKDGQVSDPVDVAMGFRQFYVPFDYVLISNALQAGATLTITYGDAPEGAGVEGDTV